MFPFVPRCGVSRLLMLVLSAATAAVAAQGTVKPGEAIFTCIDDKGRRLTSDRPIAECLHREQRVLNRDGSLRQIVPPSLTADERAGREARERKDAEARAAQADAMRRDRNLLLRYPDEAAHQRAREAALDNVRTAIQTTELRIQQLAAEARPLRDEAEFYKGKPLPAKLKTAMEANEVAVEAQRSASANQQAELGRINRLYDAELERLRRLWAGAAPGSLGPTASSSTTRTP